MNQQLQFGKVRNFLWPVASHELKKFVPMLFLIFLIAGNYNLLKIIKDATVIPAVGAEVIPFIKVWLLVPMAVLMTAFFSYMVHIFNENKAFYIIICSFLAFFTLFILVLYPNKDFFRLDSAANFLELYLPLGAKGFVSLIRFWHLCLFYTMCEIWGTCVLFILFWGFANRVTALHEAKRFYALFGLAGNSSGILAPLFFSWAGNTSFASEFFQNDPWEKTLFFVFAGVFGSGALTLLIYYFVNNLSSKKNSTASSAETHVQKNAKPKKKKMSFWESFAFMAKQPYIRNITIIVLSYNFVINLTEILWKSQLKELYPNQLDYGLYFGKVMVVTGVIATISDLIVCSNVIRRFGWTTAAMVTPFLLFVTSIGFFGFLLFNSFFESFLVHLIGLSPLALTVFFGSAQNALSRAAKYSLFDATKEISFIPLDTASRIQSKAAIDGVCSRVGKSGGSVLIQILLLNFGSLTACIPIAASFVGGALAVWMVSVKNLGKRFAQLTQENAEHPEVFDENESKKKQEKQEINLLPGKSFAKS